MNIKYDDIIANTNEGIKFDSNKLRWSLLPWLALIEVVKVYNYGAVKYSDRNWENGINYSRLYDATLRHLNSFWLGQQKDVESGLHHLAHCTFNILALLYFSITSKNDSKFDDRPSSESQELK